VLTGFTSQGSPAFRKRSVRRYAATSFLPYFFWRRKWRCLVLLCRIHQQLCMLLCCLLLFFLIWRPSSLLVDGRCACCAVFALAADGQSAALAPRGRRRHSTLPGLRAVALAAVLVDATHRHQSPRFLEAIVTPFRSIHLSDSVHLYRFKTFAQHR
jgi:hypothetical protein